MSAIRVLLVEDHETVREGLRMLLDSQPDIEVVGEAPNGRLAIEYSDRFRPHVVIMDLSMPEMNGLQATLAIKQDHPEMAIVALTRHDDAAFVDELRKAGASAYVLKQSASRELLDAVRVAIQEQLTERQRDVLLWTTVAEVPIDVLAERLDTSRGALYKVLHDARRKLRACLLERGFDLEALP